jgi:hypothetical protein
MFNPNRLYVQRGRRLFAVPKPLGLADKIAARSNVTGNWQRSIMPMVRTARVIRNG